MNSDKIGIFIRKLRNEKGMTQDELAEKCYISRQAVSKWERKITIPDSATLIILSEIFGVSINEILAGEKLTNSNKEKISNISLSIYDDRNKKNHQLKFIIRLLIIILLIFLLYYFFTSYRIINVYTISASSKRIEITNGIFVNTKSKLYFNVGNITLLSDCKISNLYLYYLNDLNEKIEIVSSDSSDINFIDFKGYDEYLDSKKIKYIINNLFLKIKYQDDYSEEIKLNLKEDYIDAILVKKDKPIKTNELNTKDIDNKEFDVYINKILNKYNKEEDTYQFSETIDDKRFVIFFHAATNVLNIVVFNSNNNILEEWNFEYTKNKLFYKNYLDNYNILYENDDIKCINGDCKYEINNKEEFYKIIDYSLGNY